MLTIILIYAVCFLWLWYELETAQVREDLDGGSDFWLRGKR